MRRECLTNVLELALSGQRRSGFVFTDVHVKVDYGAARRGRFVHRVDRAVAMWPKNANPLLGARWSCGGRAVDAVLGVEAEDRPLCSRCDWSGATDGPTVYFAEKDGLVKIGCSTSVLLRVPTLKARLLAIEPGGYAREWELHQQFADDRAFGEWFRYSDALHRHIASLTTEAAS